MRHLREPRFRRSRTPASRAAIITARKRRTGGIMGNAFPGRSLCYDGEAPGKKNSPKCLVKGWSLKPPFGRCAVGLASGQSWTRGKVDGRCAGSRRSPSSTSWSSSDGNDEVSPAEATSHLLRRHRSVMLNAAPLGEPEDVRPRPSASRNSSLPNASGRYADQQRHPLIGAEADGEAGRLVNLGQNVIGEHVDEFSAGWEMF